MINEAMRDDDLKAPRQSGGYNRYRHSALLL